MSFVLSRQPSIQRQPNPLARPNWLKPPGIYSLTIPKRSLRLRLIALVYGLILLIWSGLEDNSTLPVTVLGWGLALLSLTFWVRGKFGGVTFTSRRAVFGAALVGAASGLAAAFATAALMLVKTGLHSHVFPDYPFGMMVNTLERAPLWALAGIFAGIGALLAWWTIRGKDRA